MFCPKTGQKLFKNTIAMGDRKLPCCDLVDCPNWGRLCHHWQNAMDAAALENRCGPTCDDKAEEGCCTDLEPGDDLTCGCGD